MREGSHGSPRKRHALISTCASPGREAHSLVGVFAKVFARFANTANTTTAIFSICSICRCKYQVFAVFTQVFARARQYLRARALQAITASLLAHVAKVATLWPLCKLQRSIFSSVAMRFKVKSLNTCISGICMPISGTFKVESYSTTTAHSPCGHLHR